MHCPLGVRGWATSSVNHCCSSSYAGATPFWQPPRGSRFLGLRASWREIVLLTSRHFYLLSGAATLLFTPKVCYNVQDTGSCLSASRLLGSPPQNWNSLFLTILHHRPTLGAKVCHLHRSFTNIPATAQYQSQMSFCVVELPPQG